MTDRMDAAIDAYLDRLRREERDALTAQRVRRTDAPHYPRNPQAEDSMTEKERMMAAAGAYVDAVLASTWSPEAAAELLIADRNFLVTCMVGFACDEVIRIYAKELAK